LENLFQDGVITSENPVDLSSICLLALKAELQTEGIRAARELINLEASANYPALARQCRVIQSDTCMVVVDPEVALSVRKGKPLSSAEVIRNSVQMYHTRIEALGFSSPIRPDSNVYQLPESWAYDPDFSGYMAEYLRQREAAIPNGYFL